jgi:hypothetical protein
MEHFPLMKRLHTDVLEDKYGSVHPEVIRHNDKVREIHMADSKGISRTYAITFFTFDRQNKEILAIDDQIKHGGLIGKTFRDYGYEVRKNVISVFVTELPEKLREKMETLDEKAKVRLAEFYAKKEGEEPFIYGIVSEIYSPDFRPAEINEVDQKQDNPNTEALEKAGISKSEIWDRLGKENDWSDVKDKFDLAKSLAEGEENKLIKQVEDYIQENN